MWQVLMTVGLGAAVSILVITVFIAGSERTASRSS